MKIIVFISLLSFAFGRQLSEFNASTANSPKPWSVLILMSNYSAAGVCSGTAVGLQMVITAAHCMKGFDRVTVFSSNRTGGVVRRCSSRCRWRPAAAAMMMIRSRTRARVLLVTLS